MPNERWTKKFGSHVGEDCEPYEAMSDCGDLPPKRLRVFTEPTGPLYLPSDRGGKIGSLYEGFVVAEEEQEPGWWATCMIHISSILQNGSK